MHACFSTAQLQNDVISKDNNDISEASTPITELKLSAAAATELLDLAFDAHT